MSQAPALYMVATPIGNLSDMTYRAVESLKEAEIILCEDTRHSRHLLKHYGIDRPLRSAHSHNERDRAGQAVEMLSEGKSLAYISDAGTPSISDPGRVIARAVRDAGFRVIPIPGPSALTALASVNGFPGKTLTFEGFLSPKSGRRRNRLAELLDRREAFVLFESPHRILKLLGDLSDLDSERPVLVGRELTKLHEETIEGTAAEVSAELGARPSIKGECVVLVGPPKKG